MGEDSEREAGGEGPGDRERLEALARVVPALAHRLNNGLMAVIGLGELVLERPDAPAIPRIASTADEKGRLVVRSIKALSELSKNAGEGPTQTDLRETLRSVELLLHPLAESVGTDFRLACPDEVPTRADARALLHRLVAAGVGALAAPDPRLRLRVRRRDEHWELDLFGTGTERPGLRDVGPSEARGRGRLLRTRLRLEALGEAVAPPPTACAPRARVLVFERDPALAELVEAVLAEGGFAPTVAHDPDETLAAARGAEFELFLLAVGESPREQLAGAELADRVRAVTGAALAVVGGEALARRLGVQRALAPDFRPGELLDYVAERLAGA